jgi:DNA polymerase III subunit delta'
MFSKLIGNESVKTSLTQLISAGRVPNSLLLTGPEGVGKKQFAFELARAFICQSADENAACGQCSACTRVATFHTPTSDKGDDYDRVFFSDHPDVGLVIPYKRNLRVGAIRALEVQANFRPYEARARIFIVDDADKMNDAASNALLKTLEEPPSTTYVILVTSRPNLLLSTIRSRCQTIRFAPVSAVSIETLVRTERGLSSEDADLIARLTKGSVARALEFDLGQFRSQREVQLANIEKALVKLDRAALVRASEQMNDAKNKDLYEQNLEILESLLRDIWLLKSGSDADSICNLDLLKKLRTMAAHASLSRLTDSLTEIELLRQSLFVNINRKSATEALFMRMSS